MTIGKTVEHGWSNEAPTFVAAFSLPTVSLELVDFFFHFLTAPNFSPSSRVWAMSVVNYLYAFTVVPSAFFLGLHGLRAIFIGSIGFVSAIMVVFNYRGSHFPAGTFDNFRDSSGVWLQPLIIVAVLSAICGTGIKQLKRIGNNVSYSAAAVCIVLVILTVVFEYFAVATRPRESAFPPTRHIALLVLSLALVIALLTGHSLRRSERDI